MTTVSEDATADLNRRIAELEQRLETALIERDAAIERQTANALVNFRLQSELRATAERQNAGAEILRTIASAPGDASRSLQQIAETCARLFGAPSVSIQLVQDGQWGEAVRYGTSAQHIRSAVPLSSITVSGPNMPGQVVGRNEQINVPDLDNIDPSMAEWPGLPRAREAGSRTMCGTPLRREGKAIGALIIYRDRPLPFTPEELALQQTFADQAAIAIENARLFNATKEALERQTATADILKVIASSPSDVQPVFEAIAASANRLMHAHATTVWRSVEGMIRLAAFTPVDPIADETLRSRSSFPTSSSVYWHLIRDGNPAQFADTENVSPSTGDRMRELGRARGFRSLLVVPLMSEGMAIGTINVTRATAGSFAEGDVQLLRTFADQAVIAIENTRLFNETQEALERQTATSDILRVIAGSPSNVHPVFEAIVNSAARLFEPCSATITTLRGDQLHWEATASSTPGFDVSSAKATYPIAFDPNRSLSARTILERRIVEIPDVMAPDTPELTRKAAVAGGFQSVIFVPLINQDNGIGTIILTHPEAGFRLSEKQLSLVQTFADQAVIAIENTRLFNETQEALERQTATADILKVIASSPSDVQPVFDAIVTSAKTLLSGFSSTVYRFIEGQAWLEAFTPTTAEADEILRSTFPLPVSRFAPFEIAQAGEVTQIPDTESLAGEILDIARARGFRSMLFAPLMSQATAIGLIAVTRLSTGTFADHHVHLLKTFADQAVIAIENTRLFNEVQARTNDLTESLQQQTATADVLKVISRSAFDLQTVLETLIRSAVELSGAGRGALFLRDGELFRYRAASHANQYPDWIEFLQHNPQRAGHHSAIARAITSGQTVCVPDVLADPEIKLPATTLANIRAVMAVPLLRDGKVEGMMALSRPTPGPFTDRQIELVQTFADQAVIAIENARLFEEVQAKTRDLEESLQQQTATADVLKVISRSAFDLQTVLDTLTESAARLCGADMAAMTRQGPDGGYHHATRYNFSPEWREASETISLYPGRGSLVGRVLLAGKPVQIPDVLADRDYTFPEQQKAGGYRTLLGVPLLRSGQPIGVLFLGRRKVEPFDDKQIALVSTFADQAVIAIENARLFDEVQQRTHELSKSLDDLRTAQNRLVQTEKLASLGQLTAGIAHEIKNPLNFVNNFAALSAELTDELNETLKPAALDESIRAEVDELTSTLKDNLGKVVQHGKRADSIVKNMLLHSREGSGEHRPTDINALVDESLNLAYHGARAEKPQFNVTLQRNFDPEAGTIVVFPQEITRVFLNLISNGFYAVSKRKADHVDASFEPVVTATTIGRTDHVEIRIRDNGTGIPADVKEKMFNPFFTTKPAGEGTGLGLSMSHDIIVKQHGGTIDVDTVRDEFTEFKIILPRTSNLSNQSRGQT